LVCGGGSGIGRASALALASGGLQVVLSGRHREPLVGAADTIRSEGGRAELVVGDVTDPGYADAVATEVESRYGAIDVVVLNSAGPRPGRVLDLTDDDWRVAFELLVVAPLRLARRVMPGMADRGYGRVVLVTSSAVRQPQPDLAASTALRAAATSAMKLLSREHAARGVTVNCVAPGATDTERRREILTARAASGGMAYADADAADARQVPTGRPGRPEEIGAAVAFLASEAAGYVNGTVLTVDGGRTEAV
jgi:3-oxoacyl-[acyl-carrier protein] reductase